jgi:hypothetical protein
MGEFQLAFVCLRNFDNKFLGDLIFPKGKNGRVSYLFEKEYRCGDV